MTSKADNHQPQNAGVTLRSITLGLVLIPVNTYFIMANFLYHWRTLPTTLSLIYNVVITLAVLTLLNLALKRLVPRFAFSQGELLTIFVMLSLSSAISGHDMVQTLVPTIPYGFLSATPENEWQQLFWRYLPPWMVSDNVSSLQDFMKGESTLYTKAHLEDWIRPIFWWTMLLTGVIWVLVCLDALLRKQWVERERLAFPIIQLPLTMTHPDGWFFKSKMMWLGFVTVGVIDLINGLHVFFPAFPEMPTRSAEIGQFFTEKPWNAIGWTPLYILPFAVGLGFLMSLELSFSLWFFYLFWKGERVVGTALGLTALPGFPFNGPQGIGAYVGIACFALLGGRRYFLSILRHILHSQLDEGKEPLPYRWALLGLLGGLIFLVAFTHHAGMAMWTAMLYFLIFCLLAMGLTRVRAEAGPPAHEMFLANPRHFLVDLFGTRRLSGGSLTMMALYVAFNRSYRAHPMPHTLEGFKVAEVVQMKAHRLLWVMMLVTVVGILAACWAYLDVSYRIGNLNRGTHGNVGFNQLQRWLHHPTDTNFPAVAFMTGGFLFTGFLWWMRIRFSFWPFHPAGYAIAHHTSGAAFGYVWFPLFISWAIKLSLLKVGGIRLYRKVLPLFLGLILGEFVVGGTWVLIRLFWNVEVYSFYR